MGSVTWVWVSSTITLLILGSVVSGNPKSQGEVNFSTYSKRLENTRAPYLNSQSPEGLRTMLKEVENALNALEESRSISSRTRTRGLTYSREYLYQDSLDIAQRCLEMIKYYKKKTYFHEGIKSVKCGRCDKTRRLQDLLKYITRELQDLVYNYPPENDGPVGAVPVYRAVGEYGFHLRGGHRRFNPSIRDFSSGRGWDGGYGYESDPSPASPDYWDRDQVGGRWISYGSYNKARIQLFESHDEPWRRYEPSPDSYKYTYGWDREGEDNYGW